MEWSTNGVGGDEHDLVATWVPAVVVVPAAPGLGFGLGERGSVIGGRVLRLVIGEVEVVEEVPTAKDGLQRSLRSADLPGDGQADRAVDGEVRGVRRVRELAGGGSTGNGYELGEREVAVGGEVRGGVVAVVRVFVQVEEVVVNTSLGCIQRSVPVLVATRHRAARRRVVHDGQRQGHHHHHRDEHGDEGHAVFVGSSRGQSHRRVTRCSGIRRWAAVPDRPV